MSRAHEISWAAGFFDGEGYVSIVERETKWKDKIYKGHYLRIGINHVNPKPLQEMQRLFGGKLRFQNPEKVSGNRKPRCSWVVTTQAAANVLVQLMPYFQNKNNVAELGLELQKTMTTGRVSDETFSYRAMLKQEIQKLNSLD